MPFLSFIHNLSQWLIASSQGTNSILQEAPEADVIYPQGQSQDWAPGHSQLVFCVSAPGGDGTFVFVDRMRKFDFHK